MKQLFNEAMAVAKSYDVSTPKDGLVLYSVSFLPTKENQEHALEFVRQHPQSMVIEHTPCGLKLIDMGLAGSDCGLTPSEMAEIWGVASARMIQNASGAIHAFVKNADARSVFCSIELPNILRNPHITTINGEDKHIFAKHFSL